ncbi:MAG TPA: hypothetical protein VFT95_18195 [Micromonosporaceae bacterium]|nr:hypothetical protein [Micromonosporaceae bacterium]
MAAGCASGPPAPPTDRPTPEGPVSTSSEFPEDLPAPAGTPRAGASPTELTGVVRQGVEAGCLLLDGYLLLGGDRAVVRAGARVTVTGRVDSGVMTTCQQGTPFQVETAAPA